MIKKKIVEESTFNNLTPFICIKFTLFGCVYFFIRKPLAHAIHKVCVIIKTQHKNPSLLLSSLLTSETLKQPPPLLPLPS